MELNGKIYKVLPPVEGENENGHWVRRQFILEVGERQTRVCFQANGEEKCKGLDAAEPGMLCNVRFQPESREYAEGKWVTNLNAFGIALYQKA